MAKARASNTTASKSCTLRCAIYTRKSSEEGLGQDFNSLHAQREACEAYVLSQRHEGWALVEAVYDDGGYSGGNLERPALKRLLTDIEQHKIDVVVVYKVDRLTRALTDFARIVERFDTHGVSFVSVTQQFNTTSSMGRLTLNVLLSFAQFEREVTGERIRDKIAASKQKGMWMGGPIPLGYDISDKKLVINSTEAETVRLIYQLYLQEGTVSGLRAVLKQRGIQTKCCITKAGGVIGGKPFSRGHLYRLLNNPLYIGQVRHRDNLYEGQHPAIIDAQTWVLVQQKLKDNRHERITQCNATQPSLLAGLIEDEIGTALVPHHANKCGKRYRYYVDRAMLSQSGQGQLQKTQSTKEDAGKSPAGWRMPAQQIEQLIILAISNLLTTPAKLMEFCGAVLHDKLHLDLLLARAKRWGEQLPQQSVAEQRALLLQVIQTIVVHDSQVAIHLSPEGLQNLIAGEADSGRKTESFTHKKMTEPLIIPWQVRRRGVEMKLIIPGFLQPEQRNLDEALIRAIAKGHLWMEQITSGQVKTLAEIAKQNHVTGRWVSRLINLACLAPDIVERILDGTQPSHLTLQKLLVHEQLPADWQQQRELLLA